MRPRFFYLSKFAVKSLELAGAGLASAVAGYLLAQIGTPHASSQPLVQVTAANVELMRMLRDEHALLVEFGKELDVQRKPEGMASAPMPVPTPKPAKPAQAAPSRPRLETMAMEEKPRTGEPLPIQLAVKMSESLLKPHELSEAARPIRVSDPTSAKGEWPPLDMLRRIRAWFLPENGDAPRAADVSREIRAERSVDAAYDIR